MKLEIYRAMSLAHVHAHSAGLRPDLVYELKVLALSRAIVEHRSRVLRQLLDDPARLQTDQVASFGIGRDVAVDPGLWIAGH